MINQLSGAAKSCGPIFNHALILMELKEYIIDTFCYNDYANKLAPAIAEKLFIV